MITITISGFKTKEEAINWLTQYEGSIEQNFEDVPSCCKMSEYIREMKEFQKVEDKTNFNLELRGEY